MMRGHHNDDHQMIHHLMMIIIVTTLPRPSRRRRPSIPRSSRDDLSSSWGRLGRVSGGSSQWRWEAIMLEFRCGEMAFFCQSTGIPLRSSCLVRDGFVQAALLLRYRCGLNQWC